MRGSGIWTIFHAVFRYLPFFLAVLRYWVPPLMSPSKRLPKILGDLFRVKIRLKWAIIPFFRCPKILGEAGKKFYNKCSENSRSQIVFRTDIFRKLTLGAPVWWSAYVFLHSKWLVAEKLTRPQASLFVSGHLTVAGDCHGILVKGTMGRRERKGTPFFPSPHARIFHALPSLIWIRGQKEMTLGSGMTDNKHGT